MLRWDSKRRPKRHTETRWALMKSGAVGSSDYGPTAQSLSICWSPKTKRRNWSRCIRKLSPRGAPFSVMTASSWQQHFSSLPTSSSRRTGPKKRRSNIGNLRISTSYHPGKEHLFKLPPELVFGLLEVGEKQRAINICQALLNSTSTNALWFNNASWYLATTENPTNRDPALAVELAERAVKINPQGDWNTVGVAYYRAGDFKQALADLRKSEQRAPVEDNSYDTFFLAMAEHQVGNIDGRATLLRPGDQMDGQT